MQWETKRGMEGTAPAGCDASAICYHHAAGRSGKTGAEGRGQDRGQNRCAAQHGARRTGPVTSEPARVLESERKEWAGSACRC
jgi:hypothetical protein